MQFSIIIPTLNEAEIIDSCLTTLQPLRGQCQLIVVDGGSSDATLELAAKLADVVITSGQGRAKQMNAGAMLAQAELLIFLHADTTLPDNALQLIQSQISPTQPWGRFDIRLIGCHPMLAIIAAMMNLRSQLTGIVTGDQTFFMTKTAFIQVGGYPDLALMEDISISAALNRLSRPLCLKAKVSTSARRWQKFGIGKTILLMWSLRLRFFFKQNTAYLAELYNQGRFWSL
ncbi:MAG: TIGR04283 family arsenosugar biosynthesis glycosyltransferase [Methylococcaceae bacterium]|jgi:rSAM/selenodomain-associated transferase 2